jgi:hypothetical protein
MNLNELLKNINTYNLSQEKIVELCFDMILSYQYEFDTPQLRKEIEYKAQFIIDNYIREGRESKIDQIINNRDRKINLILNGRNGRN